MASARDSLQVLSRLAAAFKEHAPLSICYRQPVCKCPDAATQCVCDSDECFEVTSTSFDLLSNCKGQFHLRLARAGLKCTKHLHLRIFYLNDEDSSDVPLVDIDTTEQRVRVHDHGGALVDFPLDAPPTCQLGSLIFNIGYLDFDEGASPPPLASA
jgi:hypothetical protein